MTLSPEFIGSGREITIFLLWPRKRVCACVCACVCVCACGQSERDREGEREREREIFTR